ncbi:MAG: aminotransferase class I/II-fold pyridoxal phosphate-dependent enzyme [Acidobacteria bacterium]|nr:aminotransferase class I/II-fold pyridoxal phosphate-dependent enzyme [Acidobacteriota bacterium]
MSKRLPPYVFKTINDLKAAARARGEDIIDLGMGNPDIPTPKPIVNKLIEAARNPRNHRYSVSRGIPKLREAIANRYARKWGVSLDAEAEVVVTIGAKEGLSHLVLTLLAPGERTLLPEPTYPIHIFSTMMADGRLIRVPMTNQDDLLDKLGASICSERPKLLILSFPHNPTGVCVSREFFQEVIRLARRYDVMVIHDFAYADIVFDGQAAPSILEIEGAREVAVEIFSMSKSYSMPGWRVGFCVGNADIIAALSRVKSYLDYGIFQPIQIAAIIALNECEEHVERIAGEYRKRRNVLVESFGRAGWPVAMPEATMFVWARIPERFRGMGSLEFSKLLLDRAKVAVAPGVGFGESGDGHVRLALVENEKRIRQAARGIKLLLQAAPGKPEVDLAAAVRESKSQ